MNQGVNSTFQEKFAAMKMAYSMDLHGRMEHLMQRWEAYKLGEIAALEELAAAAHKIAGSAATFGFTRLTATMRTVETSARELLNADAAAATDLQQRLVALLADAQEQAANPDDEGAVAAQPIQPATQQPNPRVEAVQNTARLVYLLHDDAGVGKEFVSQAPHFNYEVQSFNTLDAFVAALGQKEPMALVIDMQLVEPQLSLAQLIETTSRVYRRKLPVVLLSSRGDIIPRLEAVRAGVAAYLTKPLNCTALIDTLDGFSADQQQEPYRIMVVDDSPVMAQLYAQTLMEAGMEVCQLTDPMQILQSLSAFSPELILMDMYMPECSGAELAAVIRQQPDFDSVPIVFLSSESDVSKQLDAMREGGDDFLTKPIAAHHLMTSVTLRASRYRVLRSMMVKDGLTGLFNHTKILDTLDIEIARAQRHQRPLSFAMIDIDHFKAINDGYGHPVGDQVIRALSRLLRDRLRKTDVVGRYGGEEFAIIMTDTEASVAQRILDEARIAFNEIQHYNGTQKFTVSFSGGVVGYRPGEKDETLVRRADEALYQAKHAGRNQIISAN